MSDGAGGAPGPLAGRRVIVTRAADQVSELVAALRASGAEVVACPVLRAEPASPAHLAPLREGLGGYAWVFFTSENGVRGLLAQLAGLGLGPDALGGALVAAVGSATAAAAAAAGLPVAFVPTRFRADAMLAEFLAAHPAAGRRILRVRGGRAPTDVEDALRESGALVDALDAYRTLPDAPDPATARDILARGADAVCFASGSAVEGFERAVPAHGLHARALAACIGPVTARAAEAVGWRRVLAPPESTAAALAAAVVGTLRG